MAFFLKVSVLWLIALSVFARLCIALGSLYVYGEHTRAQVVSAIIFCYILATWLTAEFANWSASQKQRAYELAPAEPQLEPSAAPSVLGASEQEPPDPEEAKVVTRAAPEERTTGDRLQAWLVSALLPLRAGAEMVAIMAVLYLCDRTDFFAKGAKVYNPSQFWALWALICIAALFTMRKTQDTKPLSREQTDEWKGWMQMMFLMYHYFEEKEVYNAIRVYIAAYVWMTGYGNFFLYRRGKSFTFRRTAQMLFRLNFLGLLVCVVLCNEYMLYYICAMHTLFTLFVLLAMYAANSLNSSTKVLYAKIVLTFLGTLLLYDGPDILFRSVFGTLPGVRPLFAFHDPLHPEFTDELHEFHFRSGLDRFIWIFGMVCALHYPDMEAFAANLQAKATQARAKMQVLLILTSAVVGGAWWYNVFTLNKFAYNKVHPFSSFVPLTIFLVLRNLTEGLRSRYLYLFAYMGKVTLETYIFQFHIWMKTTGINGSPKHLLQVIPGSYWLNFAVCSTAYIFLSVRFSNLTGVLRDALIPESLETMGRVWACLLGLGVVSTVQSFAWS